MKSIYTFLRLIRYPNIFFIVLTQSFFHYLIIAPILKSVDLKSALSDIDFFLLVFATVLLAAAGYIINDYFDIKIDSINKPRKLFIGKSFNRRPAILIHQIFNFIAIAIGIYLSWRVENMKLLMINPLVAALLWLYSTGYKKQPLIGNLIVSLLTGMVILIVVLFEQPLFHPVGNLDFLAAYSIFLRAFYYFIFAFLVSLIREIIKDMEDIEGDSKYGCKTLPIVFGIPRTKSIVYMLGIIVLSLVCLVQATPLKVGDYVTVIYLMQTVQFPLFVMMWLLYRADTQKDFNRISTLVKVVMLMGILTMAYFYFLMV